MDSTIIQIRLKMLFLRLGSFPIVPYHSLSFLTPTIRRIIFLSEKLQNDQRNYIFVSDRSLPFLIVPYTNDQGPVQSLPMIDPVGQN